MRDTSKSACASTDVKVKPAGCCGRLPKARECCPTVLGSLREWAHVVRLYPSTLIIPLVVLALLVGFGVWGVNQAANAAVDQQQDDARSRAVDAATGFQIQLQQSFTPGVTFQLLVKQRPDWAYWLQNFNQTADELMSRVPAGSLWNLQLQPFAQVMQIHPTRPEDLGQLFPPRDLLGDPTRRDDLLRVIATKQVAVVGPLSLVQGFTGAFVRYPIYVPDVEPEETFGFRYRENASAIPYEQLPESVRTCRICYNSTTREKWWGILTVLINYDAVINGQDSYLEGLRSQGYNYALVRPINATAEQLIAKNGPSALNQGDAVTVPVRVINNATWYLRVAPAEGFSVSWRDPLIAAVVIIAFIVCTLLFIALSSFKRQRLLLQETVAANRNLALTTKRLEEEKERMDVLLVRQYELLRCLDSNRPKRGILGGDITTEGTLHGTLGASKKAMMARIEDTRRSLNVAKSSMDEPIQVFEVLGQGAFGKVQRGLWRGTVVAVKTMILPANMTGQEKREKMAVMEAAISSSLVHPNIVTTYTYFIRPYHEPTHEGVQNMLASTQSRPAATQRSAGRTGSEQGTGMGSLEGGSSSDESTIHSYEVRLVLEFCDKGSLKDALDQQAFMTSGMLNMAAILETAADIAKAMVHMHAASVLHSDLKARNIMLKSSGMDGRGVVAKVADFGLSTRMEHQETHLSSCFQGTLTHMAPEVMLEGRISKAADVYSFGILMWELFCASDPFAGVPRAHIGHAITKENRRPKFPPFAPLEFVALASQCWDPEASQRPTFEEVLSELNRMREELGGDTAPILVMPPRSRPPTSAGADGSGTQPSGSNDGLILQLVGLNGGGVNGVHIGSSAGGMALYGAGMVVGGASTTASFGSMPGGGVGHSAVAQRAVIKSALAQQRQMRKLNMRTGSASGASLQQTLPCLEEACEAEAGEWPEDDVEAGREAAARAGMGAVSGSGSETGTGTGPGTGTGTGTGTPREGEKPGGPTGAEAV